MTHTDLEAIGNTNYDLAGSEGKAMVTTVQTSPSSEEVRMVEQPEQRPGPGEVAIAVVGAGINRADILQRAGSYALPPGATDVLGLEASGIVTDIGEGVSEDWLGRHVVALLVSGGYATQVITDVRSILPAPVGVDLLAAGGLIEGAATVVSNVLMAGGYSPGETVLIHGATGGIGAFAVQLLSALGARVAVTASSREKLAAAQELGASILIDYTTENFAEKLQSAGGADIILDTVAGPYLSQNLQALNPHGRIVTIGMQGGAQGDLDFRLLMKKRATVMGTMLRDRSLDEKARILRRTREEVWPLLEDGVIDISPARVFPLSQVDEAHTYFTQRSHVGKVVLDCQDV